MKIPRFLRKNFLKIYNNILFHDKKVSQKGFSMVAIFLIMVAMMGAATTVLISTKSNIRSAGQSREKLVSQYVAEAAVAQAKAVMISKWDAYQKWSLLLTSPPAGTNTYIDYSYGGTAGLPMVKARFRFTYLNNPDDPGLSPTSDTDGKIIISVIGEVLDPTSSTPKVLAVSNIEVQIYKENVAVASQGYAAQSHGSASQNAFSDFDVNSVNFSNSISF